MKIHFINIFFKQIKYQSVRLVLTFAFLCLYTSVFSQIEQHYTLKTVVIDPGHGGKDEGASGRKAKEKDIVLAIALKLGTYIEENFPDVKVIYTRSTDIFVPLNERAEIANKNKADLFISIHCNGNKNTRAYGTETYAMGLHKTDGNLEVAKMENSAILFEEDYSTKYEGFDPNSAESYIIFSFLQNAFLEQSLNYASFVETEFETRALRKSRGVKQAGFLVLWKTTMPSVLVETGFITNPQEEKYLMSREGQEYIASAIYRAFKNYKNMVDEKSVFTAVIDSAKNTESNSVVFKVQIASSRNSVSTAPENFKGIEQIEELLIDGMFKYTTGASTSYNQILDYKKTIEDKFPDAFIIAVQEGKILPLNEALKQIQK